MEVTLQSDFTIKNIINRLKKLIPGKQQFAEYIACKVQTKLNGSLRSD
jgi:hypothetical protein